MFHDVREDLRLPKLPAVIAESEDNNVDQFLEKLDKLHLTKNRSSYSFVPTKHSTGALPCQKHSLCPDEKPCVI